MPLPAHLRVITEARALTYEAAQLSHAGTEQALGMHALARDLMEHCGPDATPEELLSDPVRTSLSALRSYIAENESTRHRLAVEQGRRTRSYDLHPYEELVELADIAGANAYFRYARASGYSQDNSQRIEGSCQFIFYIMQHELRKQGVETKHMHWFEGGSNHHFLRTTMPDGNDIDMDPTWQQYLPKDTDYSEHPHVLVAPVNQLGDILTIHGVPTIDHRRWLEAGTYLRPERNFWAWDTALETIFSEDPWIPPLAPNQLRQWNTDI